MGMARVHTQVVACDIKVRRNALDIQVQGESDKVDVSRTLAIARETAFHTIGSCEHA
jgi:hypothetical protein